MSIATAPAPSRKVLTPVAPPRILEPVYTDEQYERMLDLIKREGPWGTIISHHFETVDEVIATISGIIPPDHGLTLDDIAGPHFRGFFAKNSVCFFPELEDIFYNRRLPRPGEVVLGRAVRQADADAVQHLRTPRHRARCPTSTP